MPPAARLNDICTGHADWPPRENIQASPNVFVNSRGWHRQGDSWAVHCNSIPECHGGVLASGSKSVFVNKKQAGRIGAPVSCGSNVATSSPNVFAGD
ncbi:MAG: PAAR domain-containing protein [Synergistaceae bacterium]|nr:PAAR domain-containing protein [Synergistaceae bacterium]